MSGGFLKRYWFLVALLCLIPVGLWAPGPGLYIKEQGHIIPVFVGLMLGIVGVFDGYLQPGTSGV